MTQLIWGSSLMPCISGSYNKKSGIILDVFVIDQKIISTLSQNSGSNGKVSIPKGMRPYRALVDTGASATCISSKVAKEVGLTPIGKGGLVSASGKSAKNKYLFILGLTLVRKVSPAGQAEGMIHPFSPIEGLEFHADETSQFDVLMGRDIISIGSLQLTFDGHFTFCF